MESTKRTANRKARTYKTDHYTQDQVERLSESANRQEHKIASLYFSRYPEGYTPSQVHQMIQEHARLTGNKQYDWPITSTRRAITSLTSDKDKEGNPIPQILEMTDQTRPGPYGKDEHVWKWKTPEQKVNPQQGDMFPPEAQPKSRAYQEGM